MRQTEFMPAVDESQTHAMPRSGRIDAREVQRMKDLLASIAPELGGQMPVRLWDGTVIGNGSAPATLVLRHAGALRAMVLARSEAQLAEAYLRDDFDIEGDAEWALAQTRAIQGRRRGWASKLAVVARAAGFPVSLRKPGAGRGPARLRGSRHSPERDRAAVRYHYDVPPEFYRVVLGDSMVYSCAYFGDQAGDLDSAQRAKLDLVCRKLRLRPGQRFLDVGCGWGSLAIHAARHYGVQATGITLSEPQADFARRRIRAAGLQDRVHVRVQDYRELDDEPYDAIASIGMFEHVGHRMLPAYFRKAFAALKPGGVFLNHGIAARAPTNLGKRGSFIGKYVFPDGELLPIHATLEAAAGAGFEVRDVESLREHYALTLRRWVTNLEKGWTEARRHVDEATCRVWRLYMAGSAAKFTAGDISIFQTLLAKPGPQGEAGLPLRRTDWYLP